MKVIRKGNDINILWEIFGEIDGVKSPYDLTGKDLSLYLENKYGRKEVTDFSTEENMVIWSFRGKDQKNLGVYSLILVVNEGEEFMHTIDECDAFEIVSHTCIAEQECKENLRISTQFNIGAITPDTSLNPDSLNVVTNAAICEALEVFRNEVNTQLAQFEDVTGADLSAYKAEINAAFADYKAEVNGTLSASVEELRSFETRIQADFDIFKTEISATLASADAEAEAFRAAMEQSYTQFTTSIQQSFAEFKNTINSELASEFGAQNTRISEAINQQNATIASEVQKQNAAIESKTAQQNATISSAIEQQNTTIATEFEKQNARIADKVSSDGKYPELTAGFANNLVGRGEAVDATIGFRASGGMSIEDGAARVKELHGNSVVWNQLFVESVNPIVATIQPNSAYTTKFGVNYIANHKYILMKSTSFDDSVYLQSDSIEGVARLIGATNAMIGTAKNSFNSRAYIRNNLSFAISIDCKIALVDLTQMFGAGNEPTSVEEFYARIPQNVDLYAYNEGEIVSTDADGIKSVGFNAWDEKWEQGMYDSANGNKIPNDSTIRNKNKIKVIEGQQYYFKSGWCQVFFYDMNNSFIGSTETGENGGLVSIPQNARYMAFRTSTNYGMAYKNDICINLSHTGYRNGEYQPYMEFIRDIDSRIREAFPNGMRSAGNASDKVYNKNGKGYIEKRIGVVDMGTLSYIYQKPIEGSVPHGYFRATVSDKAKGNANMLCGKYLTKADWTSIGVRGDESSYDVYFKDSAYTDAATFKAAMSGVMLYYELAEPEILEFDEPFNLDYEVWDFGTEQMIASKPSAPIKAKIAYGFNAVDMVRTAQIEIAELKTQIAQMQTMMASMAAQPAMIDIQTGNI